MDQALLSALNPGADFTAVGTRILVASPASAPLPAVARVEVDKSSDEVSRLRRARKIVAVFRPPSAAPSARRPAGRSPFAPWPRTRTTPTIHPA